MIMNNRFKLGSDIHHWSMAYLGMLQDHTSTVPHLDFGTLIGSTQLTESIIFPKVVTQKYNMIYICLEHAQDQ